MTDAEALEIDDLLSRVLHRGPFDSLNDAARRIMASPQGDPAWRVASALLSRRTGDVWVRMRRAAKAARRLARSAT